MGRPQRAGVVKSSSWLVCRARMSVYGTFPGRARPYVGGLVLVEECGALAKPRGSFSLNGVRFSTEKGTLVMFFVFTCVLVFMCSPCGKRSEALCGLTLRRSTSHKINAHAHIFNADAHKINLTAHIFNAHAHKINVVQWCCGKSFPQGQK